VVVAEPGGQQCDLGVFGLLDAGVDDPRQSRRGGRFDPFVMAVR